MSENKSNTVRGLWEKSPPTPKVGTTEESNIGYNPLRGSYGETDRVLRDKTPGELMAEKPNSRKLAMDAMCWDCQGGDHADDGWKWNIGNCTMDSCPLWKW